MPATHPLAEDGDLAGASQKLETSPGDQTCSEQVPPDLLSRKHVAAVDSQPFRPQGGMASGLPRVGQLLWEAILLGPPIDRGNEAQRTRRSSPPTANLPTHEERVLRMLEEIGEAAPREIAARLGWSRSTTQRVLTVLLESERVERRGTTRATVYRRASGKKEAA